MQLKKEKKSSCAVKSDFALAGGSERGKEIVLIQTKLFNYLRTSPFIFSQVLFCYVTQGAELYQAEKEPK